MRKFVLHMILFLLPVITGWLIIVSQPVDKKRAYHYLTDDCEGRGAWMYRRIYESKEPIDIAFLGSSHTVNGINDSLINQLLRDSGLSKKVCNLGYCRLGRDLTYVLMKELIEQKKTRTFIIEVLQDEYPHSHPVFPFMADPEDVIKFKTPLNTDYPNNLYSTAVAKWVYTRQNWMNEPYPYKYTLRENDGFNTNTFEADTNQLEEKKKYWKENAYKSHRWTRRFNLPFPRAWLADIASLAQKNNCKIYFLYLPPYGAAEKQPIEWQTYTQYATTWTIPDSVLNDKKNWYDTDHMNLRGANAVSRIVSGELIKQEQ